MGEGAIEMMGARFRVLSEASRLKLIFALEDGEKNVSALVSLTKLTQAKVSRQLHILTGEGILGRRKNGLNVIYHIADKSTLVLCESIHRSMQHQSRIVIAPPRQAHKNA